MNFEKLASQIQQTNEFLQQKTVKAINIHLTLRNWLTGFYIVEFEQNGSDKAEYGSKLLENLAKKIGIKGLPAPELSRCRQFYYSYPKILGIATQEFKNLLSIESLFKHKIENQQNTILGTPSQELSTEDLKHISTLLKTLSYSHFVELIKIEDRTKRHFYELLILKTQPTIKELKRQIDTLTYERVGLSQTTTLLLRK